MGRVARAGAVGCRDSAANWAGWRNEDLSQANQDRMRRHTQTCRPLGDPAFPDRLEPVIGRILRPPKRGPNQSEQIHVTVSRNC